MPASEDVYLRVKKAIVESLNVDEGDITPMAALQKDLGAESIDLLDVVFRLEREFKLKIARDELFPESIFQGNSAFIKDGMVTNAGMAELRLRMPYADLESFDRDRRLIAVPDLFTVDLITRFIEHKLSLATQVRDAVEEAA